MLTLDKIYHAAFVLRDVARRTDLIAASRLNSASDLYLKTENLQVTGSFKVRGAYYKISQLTAEERAKGVIACSAGNHAQGVALAATSMGIKSVVCMPDGAPLMKVESTKRLGAQVELVKGTYDDAHDRAVELQKETGMTFIHPYDDELVIAGQGTIGLEILDQLPDVEAVVVPNIDFPLFKALAPAVAVLTGNVSAEHSLLLGGKRCVRIDPQRADQFTVHLVHRGNGADDLAADGIVLTVISHQVAVKIFDILVDGIADNIAVAGQFLAGVRDTLVFTVIIAQILGVIREKVRSQGRIKFHLQIMSPLSAAQVVVDLRGIVVFYRQRRIVERRQ